jgi:hypothetical protein
MSTANNTTQGNLSSRRHAQEKEDEMWIVILVLLMVAGLAWALSAIERP